MIPLPGQRAALGALAAAACFIAVSQARAAEAIIGEITILYDESRWDRTDAGQSDATFRCKVDDCYKVTIAIDAPPGPSRCTDEGLRSWAGEQSAGDLDEEGPFSVVRNNLTFLGLFADPDCPSLVGKSQFACTHHNGQDHFLSLPSRDCNAPTFQDESFAEMMESMHPN